MVTAMHTSASFKSDFEAAKAKLEKVRAGTTTSLAETDACKDEARTLEVRAY